MDDEASALREVIRNLMTEKDRLEAEVAALKTSEAACSIYLDSPAGRAVGERLASLSSLEDGVRNLLLEHGRTLTDRTTEGLLSGIRAFVALLHDGR